MAVDCAMKIICITLSKFKLKFDDFFFVKFGLNYLDLLAALLVWQFIMVNCWMLSLYVHSIR